MVGFEKVLGGVKVIKYQIHYRSQSLLNLARGYFKVGSHDPISIQLTLKIFVCVMEFVGIYTIQFLHPIIVLTSSKNFNNSCFENFKHTSPQLDPAVAAIL